MSRRFWFLAILASLALHVPLWLVYQDHLEQQEQQVRLEPVFTSRILSTNELDKLMRRDRGSVQSQSSKVEIPKNKIEADYVSDKRRRVDKQSVSRGRPGARGSEDAGSDKWRRLGMQASVSDVSTKAEPSRIRPSGSGMLRKPAGENGSVDVLLSDVVQGSETLLNTDEYVFASFFNRLKSQVEPRWSPVAREIMKRQWRSLPEGLYVTELSLGTDDLGKITFVEVVRSSGFADFDRAATNAMWDLGRVANLPRELLDRDQRYRTKLTFVVDFKKNGMRFDTITENEENRW